MANITQLTPTLWTGGDLPEDDEVAADHIGDWRDAGITTVIDCRFEWSDEELVAAIAPEIHYVHVGVDDAGQRIPPAWFDDVARRGQHRRRRQRRARALPHGHQPRAVGCVRRPARRRSRPGRSDRPDPRPPADRRRRLRRGRPALVAPPPRRHAHRAARRPGRPRPMAAPTSPRHAQNHQGHPRARNWPNERDVAALPPGVWLDHLSLHAGSALRRRVSCVQMRLRITSCCAVISGAPRCSLRVPRRNKARRSMMASYSMP